MLTTLWATMCAHTLATAFLALAGTFNVLYSDYVTRVGGGGDDPLRREFSLPAAWGGWTATQWNVIHLVFYFTLTLTDPTCGAFALAASVLWEVGEYVASHYSTFWYADPRDLVANSLGCVLGAIAAHPDSDVLGTCLMAAAAVLDVGVIIQPLVRHGWTHPKHAHFLALVMLPHMVVACATTHVVLSSSAPTIAYM
jgi:hypothetical protein